MYSCVNSGRDWEWRFFRAKHGSLHWRPFDRIRGRPPLDDQSSAWVRLCDPDWEKYFDRGDPNLPTVTIQQS